jgi:hypothetical protein
MLPRLTSWTITSTCGRREAISRATVALSSGDASSMMSTRTSTPPWSSRTLLTAASRKWP